MRTDYIHVTQRDTKWSVRGGRPGSCLLTFRLKPHAVAYARAVAYSRKLALFIDDRNGVAVRQSSSSLTYPVFLD
jgi:hypothetical protein